MATFKAFLVILAVSLKSASSQFNIPFLNFGLPQANPSPYSQSFIDTDQLQRSILNSIPGLLQSQLGSFYSPFAYPQQQQQQNHQQQRYPQQQYYQPQNYQQQNYPQYQQNNRQNYDGINIMQRDNTARDIYALDGGKIEANGVRLRGSQGRTRFGNVRVNQSGNTADNIYALNGGSIRTNGVRLRNAKLDNVHISMSGNRASGLYALGGKISANTVDISRK